MREAVVVASSRTALAKSYRGSFNMTRPDELAAHCIRDVLRKTPSSIPTKSKMWFWGARNRTVRRGKTWLVFQPCWLGCRRRSPA